MGHFCMSVFSMSDFFFKMVWHFCFYERNKSHSERRFLGSPSGKSPHWGRALSNAIWLGENSWVQLKCFTWKIQILFTESETAPKTAGPLAQFHSQVLQSEQDRWTVQVPGSHLSPWLLLSWPWLLVQSVPHAPTCLCIQFLQTSDPQKVLILCEVPYLPTDSCLSNLHRKRQKISYILE